MMSDSGREDQILADLLAREAADRAGESLGQDKPEPEELLDFLRGGVPTGDEEELQAKLVADPEASRRLLEIDALVRDGEAAAKSTTEDLAAAAGWRELQGRLPGSDQGSPSRPATEHSPPMVPAVAARPSPFWLQPVAAMLLLSTISLSILLLRRPPAPIMTLANIQTVMLVSGQRSVVEIEPIAIAPGQPIILLLDPEKLCPSYRLTITGSGSTHSLEGLSRNTRGAEGTLVASAYLAPGSYKAVLEGCSPQQVLERYSFQVTEAP